MIFTIQFTSHARNDEEFNEYVTVKPIDDSENEKISEIINFLIRETDVELIKIEKSKE